MADVTMPTIARLYTQGRYRRASVKPGPGKALVLRDDAELAGQYAYESGLRDGRSITTDRHTEYPADIGIAPNGEV